LLPILLIFIWRLAASTELMGEYRNGRAFNVIAGFTVVATSTLSILLLVITFSSIA
jgi:Mn2+/Fe2+ NRAMP family transporter